MLATQSASELKDALLQRLADARARTDELFKVVRPDALYDRPIPERHRIIFYIGHLEAFDWNLLRERALHLPAFDPDFDRLFAFGIDPVGGGLPTDQPQDWPTLQRIQGYVAQVREDLDRCLETSSTSEKADEGDFALDLLLNVAIEHRLMHAETLAYMLHQLPLSQKIRSGRQTPYGARNTRISNNVLINVPAGTASLGLPRGPENPFGWDNEFELQQVQVPAFEIDKFMVSNGEYLEFMRVGGYDNRTFWSDPGWQWKTDHAISHPVFWTRKGDNWYQRTMLDEVPLPLDWPVYVSHAEAGAYARWAGKKLPTEAQWHRAAYGTSGGRERLYPWGDQPPHPDHGNFDFQSWDPAPVNSSPAGESGFGVSGLIGNGWEWTSTLFAPFPGFEKFPFYPGYSADFFDSKHYVMKGGSPRTGASMLRRSFRNWFQPHYQYVYAGFRCVKD